MTTPIADGLLTVPYVGLTEFKTAPTWLDLQDLVPGGDQAQNDAELYNQLLKASAWADNFCAMPLRAHVVTEQVRSRVDRRGRLMLHPAENPVRSITGLAYGPDPTDMQVITNLSSQVWVEDQRGIVIALTGINAQFAGTLQFGGAPISGNEVYVQYQYIAGWANTYLTAATSTSSPDMTVADPTGFVPPSATLFSTSFGGSVARIWDPAQEEAVTIAPSYVQGANPLVATANLQFVHEPGVQVSEFPPEVRQSVIQYAIGLLLRDETGDDLPYPGSPGPVARRSGSRGVAGGLIDEAERMLMPYRRVR